MKQIEKVKIYKSIEENHDTLGIEIKIEGINKVIFLSRNAILKMLEKNTFEDETKIILNWNNEND
jgi:hypothetical protein